VGSNVTLADIAIAVFLPFEKSGRIPLDGYPEIRRWYAQIEKLDAWKKTAPPL
jgi:glutathione S-transferase